jgi:hypothetical protein
MPDEPIVITTRFERVLMGVEKELSTALERARNEADHAVIKGTKVEVATRKMLRDRLPPNLTIGEGIVYDSYGDETGQMDIVIANRDQPFTFPSPDVRATFELVTVDEELLLVRRSRSPNSFHTSAVRWMTGLAASSWLARPVRMAPATARVRPAANNVATSRRAIGSRTK